MLIFGPRANPLSYFLSRSLNLRLTGKNVFVVDTPQTREQNRLPEIRSTFGCTELPDLAQTDHLEQVVSENEITDIIDLTNTQPDDVDASLKTPESVRLVQPIFTTCMDIAQHKVANRGKFKPILPGIIYPFQLTEYGFPRDLATFLFW